MVLNITQLQTLVTTQLQILVITALKSLAMITQALSITNAANLSRQPTPISSQ